MTIYRFAPWLVVVSLSACFMHPHQVDPPAPLPRPAESLPESFPTVDLRPEAESSRLPTADARFHQVQNTLPEAGDEVAPVEVVPVDVAATVVVPTDVAPIDAAPIDVLSRLRANFSLPLHLDNRQVQREVQWFANHQDYLTRVFTRANPHLHYITEELIRHQIPLELALLPVVESAFDPFAYSHGRASGLWQFIPATARLYGIRIDWWYDGRRDVIDSTQAAIRYLTHLNQHFDDNWLLALAAYNSGEGNVRKALRRSGDPGADFWDLARYLPRETRAYVPRLLAISAIVADPEHYGVTLPVIPDEPTWTLVDIGSQLDLAKASELADLSPESLHRLNAGYNQWATHPNGPHRLILPIASQELFLAQLPLLTAAERMSWTRYTIRAGDSLGRIASRFGTTVGTLRSVNRISGSLIRVGDSLLIPSAPAADAYPLTADARLARNQSQLEKQYGVKPIEHTVVTGDSLWRISRQYGVNIRDIARWNGIGTTSLLRPGQKLKLFVRDALPQLATQEVMRKVNYRVRRGESLSLIANKFNVSLSSIRAWNKDVTAARYLQPGDRLTLYVDVTATE